VTFIEIDPYPHHHVAAIQYAIEASCKSFQAGNLSREATENTKSILVKALGLLPQPQVSGSSHKAKEDIEAKVARLLNPVRETPELRASSILLLID
jgi:hypothetical protein